MNYFGILVLALVIDFSVNAYYEDLLHVYNMEVIHVESDYKYLPNFLVINDTRNCGGSGKFISLRFNGCPEKEKACQYSTGEEPWISEIELEPSEDSNGIGKRVVYLIDGMSHEVYAAAIPDSQVKAGKRIIVRNSGHDGKDLTKGVRVTAQTLIYSVDENEVEICIEFDFVEQ